MLSPQMRDATGVETRSPIFFTLCVPHHITGLPWITKFSLKHQVLVSSRPTYMGSGLKQHITIIKTCVKVTWKRRENASSLVCFFLTWMSFSLFPRRSSGGILQLIFAVKHQPCMPQFSLKAAELTQKKTLQNRKKCLLEALFYRVAQIPENT